MRSAGPVPVIARRELTDADLAAFQKLAFELAGIHIAANKREMLATRLARRLTALGLASYRAYFHYLTGSDPSGDEREHFINCITTNKTGFFREPHHFELLRDQVIPAVRARAAAGGPRRLRIWSCACSTGEEPYSIAMVAHRELARDGFAIEIVASDIDTEVLARAEDAHYTTEQVAQIPADLRLRYVERRPGGWRICDELRGLLALHRVNLIHDAFPFAGPFDAIFVRNVIIYFDRPTQRALVQRLRGYLADTGHLFLGHSESLLHVTDAFVPAGRTVYRPRLAHASPPRRRGPATITPLGPACVVASAEPLRIDAIVGPSVAACVFDPEAGVGGLVQLLGGHADDSAAERELAQLVDRLVELGGARLRLRGQAGRRRWRHRGGPRARRPDGAERRGGAAARRRPADQPADRRRSPARDPVLHQHRAPAVRARHREVVTWSASRSWWSMTPR